MVVLFFVVFIDLVGFGIILPLQPFFAKQLGAADSVVTLVAASFTAAQLIFAPFWGALSDRIGRRKVMLITIAGTALGYFWLAFADTLLMLFLARFFGGAMAANMGVAQAYVADISTPDMRARRMGRVGAAAGLGFVAGPAIGGLLAGSDPANPAVHIPFLTAGAASAIAFFLAIFVLKDTGTATGKTAQKGDESIARGVMSVYGRAGRNQLYLLIGLMFVTPFVFTGVETTLALWTARVLSWGAEQNGWLYTYMGAVAVVAQGLVVGPLVGRLGERRAITLGAAAAALGALSLPFAGGFGGLMAGLGLIVFGVSISGPSLNSLVAGYAPPDKVGRTMGMAQRSAGLGRVAGPASSGLGFEHLSRDWPAFSGAVVLAVLSLAARALIRGREP